MPKTLITRCISAAVLLHPVAMVTYVHVTGGIGRSWRNLQLEHLACDGRGVGDAGVNSPGLCRGVWDGRRRSLRGRGRRGAELREHGGLHGRLQLHGHQLRLLVLLLWRGAGGRGRQEHDRQRESPPPEKRAPPGVPAAGVSPFEEHSERPAVRPADVCEPLRRPRAPPSAR